MSANIYSTTVQFTGTATQQKVAAAKQMQAALESTSGKIMEHYAQQLVNSMNAPGLFAPLPARRPVEANCKACAGSGRLNIYGQHLDCKTDTRCLDCSGTGRPPLPFTEVWDLPNEAEAAEAEQAMTAKMMQQQHSLNIAGNGAFFQQAMAPSKPKKTFDWKWWKK